jgi:hypothetical protein
MLLCPTDVRPGLTFALFPCGETPRAFMLVLLLRRGEIESWGSGHRALAAHMRIPKTLIPLRLGSEIQDLPGWHTKKSARCSPLNRIQDASPSTTLPRLRPKLSGLQAIAHDRDFVSGHPAAELAGLCVSCVVLLRPMLMALLKSLASRIIRPSSARDIRS